MAQITIAPLPTFVSAINPNLWLRAKLSIT
jgi:hypothetical protein